MLIAALKLADIAARSLFVLLALYSLPVRSTGQFGLALTLIGFFTFVSGFERYADLQRRMVGTTPIETDRLIVSALRFYAINYLATVPVLLAALVYWVELPAPLAGMCMVIAVSEHLSNEVYRIALIAPRHRMLLFAVLAKNVVVLAVVAGLLWLRPATFDIDHLLAAWAAISLAGTAIAAIGFTRTWAFASIGSASASGLRQGLQYRASRTHFLIGLVALSSLQVDRLLAGGLLSLEQSGLYFRHVFVASFAYQVFNVASYNRIAPQVYANLHAANPVAAHWLVRREMTILVPLALMLVGVFYALPPLNSGRVEALQSINPTFLALLTVGYLVRARADFNGLLLNATYAERKVFVSQLTALTLAIAFNVALTRLFGLAGTVATLVCSATAYLMISGYFTHQTPLLAEHARR